MWDGAVVTNGRCYTEYGVSVLDAVSGPENLILNVPEFRIVCCQDF